MQTNTRTVLQERILRGLVLRQKPAQIAFECDCSMEYVRLLGRRFLGPVIKPGSREAKPLEPLIGMINAPGRHVELNRHAEKMRERNGARHWGSILLEREVRRGEIPVECLPPDARYKKLTGLRIPRRYRKNPNNPRWKKQHAA